MIRFLCIFEKIIYYRKIESVSFLRSFERKLILGPIKILQKNLKLFLVVVENLKLFFFYFACFSFFVENLKLFLFFLIVVEN